VVAEHGHEHGLTVALQCVEHREDRAERGVGDGDLLVVSIDVVVPELLRNGAVLVGRVWIDEVDPREERLLAPSSFLEPRHRPPDRDPLVVLEERPLLDELEPLEEAWRERKVGRVQERGRREALRAEELGERGVRGLERSEGPPRRPTRARCRTAR
jgi:hypothetical protein